MKKSHIPYKSTTNSNVKSIRTESFRNGSIDPYTPAIVDPPSTSCQSFSRGPSRSGQINPAAVHKTKRKYLTNSTRACLPAKTLVCHHGHHTFPLWRLWHIFPHYLRQDEPCAVDNFPIRKQLLQLLRRDLLQTPGRDTLSSMGFVRNSAS